MTDTQDTPQVGTPEPQDGGQSFDAEYVGKLRSEAAGWRKQVRDLESQLKELRPAAERARELEDAQKSEQQKLADSLAALRGELDATKAAAARAEQQRALTILAAKAGVSADVLNYLDASKFDLDDEEATLAALQALAPQPGASRGSASNPARSNGSNRLSEDELRDYYLKGNRGGSPLFNTFGG